VTMAMNNLLGGGLAQAASQQLSSQDGRAPERGLAAVQETHAQYEFRRYAPLIESIRFSDEELETIVRLCRNALSRYDQV
jgi:hypothetical protein